MKEFKKIIIAIVGFVVCFLVFDFGVGKIFESKMQKLPRDGERVAKSNYVLNKAEADIMIVGSSRAECHYDPEILKQFHDGYTAFNCGVDGQGFYYSDVVVNSILDRCSPKLIIWDFNLSFLIGEGEEISLLYPYYGKNDHITSLIIDIDPSLKYRLWINSYKWSSTTARIIRASRMEDNPRSLGFNPGKTKKTGIGFSKKDVVFNDGNVDSAKVAAFERTLSRCKEQGVNVVVVISPSFNFSKGKNATMDYLCKASSKNNFVYINDNNLEEFHNKEDYFYDTKHLNRQGAVRFSEVFLSQIKQYFIE